MSKSETAAGQKERITLHRGLAELKLIDARIQKGISDIVPVGLYQKDKPVNGVILLDDFITNATKAYQSVTDLIKRKQVIKTAIVKANAETEVEVAGVKMTIADAITEKQNISLKELLVANLKEKYNHFTGKLNKANEQVQSNLKTLLEATLGKENVKAAGTDVDAVSKPYLAMNEVLFADPLKVQDEIAKLEQEIGDFKVEVDAALSTINATTFIEI